MSKLYYLFGILIVSLTVSFNSYAQLTVTAVPTDVKCFNGNDGEILVTISNVAPLAAPPWNVELQYRFFDGSFSTLAFYTNVATTSFTFKAGNGSLNQPGADSFGIPANGAGENYRVIVNASGTGTFIQKNRSVNITINQPTQIQITTNLLDPDCNPLTGGANADGTIDLTITGGIGSYSVSWPTTPASTPIAPSVVANGGNIVVPNLDGGSYTISVTDANNCNLTQNISLPISTLPNAGTDFNVCGTSTPLSGNTPGAAETGTWTGPPGVTFSPNANSPTATASNLAVGANTLTWTITTAGCTGNSDQVIVTVTQPPTTSVAGSPQTICPTANATLAANTPVIGIGVWSVSSGPSLLATQFSDTASPSSTFTPAAGPGNYVLTWSISNGICPVSQSNVTITVSSNNTAGPPSSTPTLCVNTALTNITHTTTGATGIGAPTGLPAGVTAAWAANVITISGTPTATGTFNYSIPLTGGCGTVNATGTITVSVNNTVSAASSTPTLCVNTALTNITHTTTGATGIGAPTGLPAGVTAAWAANVITISGTPTATGTFNYSIPLTGGCGTVNATGTITVSVNNTVSAASSTPTLCVNTALTNITHTTTGATGIGAPTGLPAGVTAAWAANVITISGTPTATGTFNYSIPLTGGCGTVNATGTITVSVNNTVSAASSTPTLCVNTALTNITHTTTGATGIGAPTGLPAGVTAAWAANVITISGTPTATGTFNYSIPLTGGCGTVNATGTITVSVNNTAGAPSSTPTLCVNTALTNITHTTTGATGIGAPTGLPAGVTAAWAANVITISGTPTATGTFNYSIPLTGGCGTVNATGTITVSVNNTAGAPSSTPTLCVNTALTNITHTTTGATGIGAPTGLPAGVTAAWAANVITISGTPTASGTFNYSIPLTGGCGTVNATGTITVSVNNTAGAPSSTPTLCVNTALTNITHSTTGATGIGAPTGLPVGVTAAWAANVITISGTPTATGTFNYSITLTGGCGTVNATGTITVSTNNTVSAASSTPTLCVNTALTNITHTTTGATGIGAPTGLPAGVTAAWAANVITISGTPTATGTFNYSIPLTGGCGTVNATGTITVSVNNTAGAPSSTPTLCVNNALTNITHSTTGATGIGAPTGLPAGVTAAWAANVITISGTPTATGTFNYSIPLTGGCGTVNATGTITVSVNNTAGAPSSTPTLCVNTALTNITHTTTGATGIGAPTGLPAGVTAAWAANVITISGTPTATGTFNYSIPLTGGCGTVNATGTITVSVNNTAGAPSSTPTLCVNTALTNITHTTTGATGIGAPTGLPAGVTAAWAANVITISGTPTATGTFNYSIPLTGGCGTVNATGTITVSVNNTAGAPSSTPILCVNTALTNITHTTTGATGIGAPTGLPAGVTAAWAANVITISGTPTATGTFNYSITLTGGCGTVNATGTITVSVNNTAGAPSSTPTLCVNTALTNITHTTTGATGIGAPTGLPAGVTAAWAANVITISGTPTATGTFNYSIPLTGGCGTVNATGTITVSVNNTAGAPSSTPTLCVNTALTNITHSTTGATGIGAPTGLPAGVTAAWAANVITISGTPTATGTFNYSIPLTGGCGTVNATGTITVSTNNTVSAASSTPTLCVNTALTNITHNTTGATGIGAPTGLPAGVTAAWAANVITISGTPTATGTFNYSIPLTGGCGLAINATGTINVTSDNTAGAASSTPTLCVNTALTNITHTTTGATGIGAPTGLPAGVTAAWAANVITISGTPTASGTFNYSIPLTGGCGTVSATGTINVTPDNTAGPASSTPTLCVNTTLTNITHTTTGATGIGAPTGLPAGVTAAWAANVITISGTPTATGTFNYSIPLTGGCGTVNATGTITVSINNTVGVASSTPTLCVNTALINITHTTTGATGIGAPTGLPAGVTAAWAANVITISGTPTATGTFNYSIPLTGGCGLAINATGTINVTPDNTAGAASATPTLCVNTALTNITHTTSGATGIGAPTGLPAGVTAAWAANVITISGTPTASGTFNYSIPLTGGCGTVSATGTINVTPDNTAGPASSTPTLCVNTALINITHATTGATGIGAPIGLPAGVTAVWAANVITISGTPTATGTFNYSIPLTGGCGTVSATGTINVTPDNTAGPASSTPTLCVNTTLTNITHTTTGATGIGAPTGLPAGVNAAWAANVITISGTPTASGTFNYSIPLTGGCGTINATGTIIVNPAPVTSSISGATSVCENTTASAYSVTNTVGSTYAWTITGGVQASGTNTNSITVDWGTAGAGSVNVTETNSNTCIGTPVTLPVTINPLPTGSLSGNASICVGQPTTLTINLTGTGPWNISYSDGSTVTPINGIASSPHIFTVTPFITTTYSLVAVSDANCTGAPSGTALVTVNPIPGDQVTFGNETWIGYVYNDVASPSPPVSNINYSGAKYRGFVNEGEIGSFGTSTYDLSKDSFDMNLGNAIPISGTNICGSFVDDFSVRFKMRKTLAAGIYNFSVSGDDGVRLFIDGALVTLAPANSFTTHSYTTYTASNVCITAGQHDFILEYFERGGFARVSFDYQIVPAPAVISPVAVCVNTTAPTLTVNPVDATATGYRWFSDAALTTQVGSGSSFTPSAAQLDLTVAATTSFFVAADYACGQGSSTQVDVNVVSSATITNPATAPTVCQTGGVVDLTTLVTVSPAGGTLSFSGTGVTGNNFDPTGLTGAITITPTYSVGTCVAPSVPFTINVTTTASVTVPASATTICQSAAAIDLTTLVTGSPAGGTFTSFVGPGVTGNLFNPATLSGTQSITANYSIGGCTGSGIILIDVINTATLNLPATQTVCQTGGNINLASLVTASPTGGTFTFTGTGVNSPAATFNPSGLSGLQTINVSYNAAGCSATGSFQFNVINTASLNLTNSNICRNAGPLNLITLATASPSGGAFSFSGTQVAGSLFDPTGLSGAINIAVSYNQGGCTANGTLIMTVLDSSNPSCTPTGNCATVVITPVPSPATCTLSNGSINFNINPATPTINNTGVKITITGISSTNNTISRTNFNDPAFPALPIGVYNYVIEYGDPSCTKNGQVTIDQSGTVGTPVATNILGPQCAGASTGSLQLDVPGETGNLLQWSLDGITFNNFTAGSVITGIPAGLAPSFQRVLSVRRNASDPCFAAVTVTIQDANPAITTTLTTTDATCANNDGTVVIGAISGGVAPYTFLLDGAAKVLPGNNTFTDQTGGNHIFSVVDANGCQKDFPYTINFPGLVNYTTAITPPDCSANGTNGTILLTITSAGTFQVGITTDPINPPTTIQNVISNGSTVVPFGGLSNNTYYISMTPTGAACPTKTLGLDVSSGPSEVDFSVAPLDIVCFENKGGVALTSIKGSLTVNYTYEIVDSNGNLVPAASVSPANPITQLQALGTVNLMGLDKGDYKIRLYQDQSVATDCTNPISSAFKSITIAGPSASLDTLFTVRKISLPDLATGSLLVGIKESQQEPYEIQLELKTPVISGQFYLLNPFGVPARNPQNLIMQYEARNLFAGLYELKITDALGCQKVYPDIEIKVDTEIFIPNVFTPNGDQTNDTFYIRNLPPGSQVNITNRWGAEIYSSSNYENNWDGGTTADGIYFYRITAGGSVFTGWLEIIRGQ